MQPSLVGGFFSNDKQTALIATISVLLLSAFVLDNIWLTDEQIDEQFPSDKDLDKTSEDEDIHYLHLNDDSGDMVKAINFGQREAYASGLLF